MAGGIAMNMSVAFWIVALVALQRLGELALSNRNTKRLLAQGSQEFGAAHYPLIVALHGGWLATLLFASPDIAAVNWLLIGAFGALQCGRIWVLASLGPYWTTRIIHVPEAPLVRSGPYRWLRHPNYVIVSGEILILPLAFGMTKTAIGFSLANAAILYWRIRVENEVLATRKIS